MARAFATTGPGFIRDWLQREPTSSYARRIGFFYEWLTAELIECVADSAGNYVDAIDADRYLVATRPDKNRRWRVNDNLPGTRDFCPMIRRVSGVLDSAALTQAIDSMQAQFDPGTLERALRWLSVKESRASFVIESEGREEDRIRRFARAMDRPAAGWRTRWAKPVCRLYRPRSWDQPPRDSVSASGSRRCLSAIPRPICL